MNVSEYIKSTLTMTDVARFYGFEPNRAGFIKCPFHGDKTASMKLYPANRGFSCFGCNASGSVIDFVMRLFSLPYRDAITRLNADFALGIDLSAPPDKEALRAHRAAQIERERRHEQFLAEYTDKTAEFRRLWNARLYKSPTDPEYIESCHRLDYLEWWLNENIERIR